MRSSEKYQNNQNKSLQLSCINFVIILQSQEKQYDLCQQNNAKRSSKIKVCCPTAARILILQKLSEQTHPISLLELEAQLETLDKSTISRSLAILLEHHAVHAFEDGSGSMKYEICRSDTDTCFIENRHIHFYCEVCHKTYCMDPIKIPVVQLPEGFIMDTINYTVKGICPACKPTDL